MKKLLIILLIIPSVCFSQGGWLKPNNSYGMILNRINPDSTVNIPTYCGAPSGTASLHAYNLHKSALYYDSCGKKMYYFNPSDSSWALIGSGSLSSTPSLDSVLAHGGDGGNQSISNINTLSLHSGTQLNQYSLSIFNIGGTGSATITTNGLTDGRTYQSPDANGYFTLSVSGKLANNLGNIPIDTSQPAIAVIVGEGHSDSPAAGSNTYTNTRLINIGSTNSNRFTISVSDVDLRNFGLHPGFSFNNSTGTISLSNSNQFINNTELYINLNQ